MSERRDRILAAAREIIAEQGYEGLSMRDLARRSRVTVPTIYNLVGAKEEVLFAASEEQTARFTREIASARGAEPADRIVAVHEACVRELLRWPRYYRAFLLLLVGSNAEVRVRSQVGRALVEEIGRGVDALAQAGLVAPWADVAALAGLLQRNMMMASLQWASGELADARLRAVSLYGACCILAGASQGETRDAFARRAAELQASARPGGTRQARRTTPARKRG
jgi:AcrR family transcriptional regulator